MIDIKKSIAFDSRVATALSELNLNYSTTEEGDYAVGFETECGRTQIAIIRSETFEFSGVEYRSISSPAFVFKERLDADSANYLLACNHLVKMGAWKIAPSEDDGDDGLVVAFNANIPADTTGAPLIDVLNAVIWTTDNLESLLRK
jgi:hypothetical protein